MSVSVGDTVACFGFNCLVSYSFSSLNQIEECLKLIVFVETVIACSYGLWGHDIHFLGRCHPHYDHITTKGSYVRQKTTSDLTFMTNAHLSLVPMVQWRHVWHPFIHSPRQKTRTLYVFLSRTWSEGVMVRTVWKQRFYLEIILVSS